MQLVSNVIGLCNGITHPDTVTNPFIHNTVGGCKILKKIGHKVRFFGAEGSKVDCDEFYPVVLREELERSYGTDFDQQKTDLNKHGAPFPHEMHEARTKHILKEVSKPGEFLLTFAGPPHQSICDALSTEEFGLRVVEPAAGYTDAFSQFRVWPSSAWMHLNYGRYQENWELTTQHLSGEAKYANLTPTSQPLSNHKPMDAVIPHYIFPERFETAEKPDDYMLQLSRIVPTKGIEMAINVAERLGKKLIIAGHGDFEENMGFKPPKHVELLGPVLREARSKLIANAWCMLAWSTYPESFGLSPMESMMGDRPAVVSQFGAFLENIVDGVNGFKTRTFQKTCEAVEKCGDMGKGAIRQYTIDKFSIDAIAPLYEAYFWDLYHYLEAQAAGEGFYHWRG